jgi:ABC-2 type transport system ATP-binding protein
MSVRSPLVALLVAVTSLAGLTGFTGPTSVAVAAPAAAAPAAAAADVVAPEVTSVPVRPEPDGTAVRLDVSVWPQPSGKHPVVLLAHGFGGSKDSVTDQATALHERGYVVVAWSARGHGASGGRMRAPCSTSPASAAMSSSTLRVTREPA